MAMSRTSRQADRRVSEQFADQVHRVSPLPSRSSPASRLNMSATLHDVRHRLHTMHPHDVRAAEHRGRDSGSRRPLAVRGRPCAEGAS